MFFLAFISLLTYLYNFPLIAIFSTNCFISLNDALVHKKNTSVYF